MARTGKIARLSREIRHQLNRRLDDGECGRALVAWLNSLPEVHAVMTAEFAARPVTEQNLSEWKQGGYREWVAQQEMLGHVRRMSADAEELGEAAGGMLADKLAACLAARYVSVMAEWDGDPESGIGRKLRALRTLALDVVELRRGDHSAARLKIEQSRLDAERAGAKATLEEQFWEWARKPEIRDKICQGYQYMSPAEKICKVRLALFGSAPESPSHGETGPEACGAEFVAGGSTGQPAKASPTVAGGGESGQIKPNPT